MFYYLLKYVNFIFTIFGIRKPFLLKSGKSSNVNVWHRLWSLFLIALLIFNYIKTMESGFTNSLKKNLNIFCKTNEVVVNVLIILVNLCNGENICLLLYEGVEKNLQDFGISDSNIKLLLMKIYIGFVVVTSAIIAIIVFEIIYMKTAVSFIAFPMYLSTFHLTLHLFLLLAVLKLVTTNMKKILFDRKILHNNYMVVKIPKKIDKLKYLLSFKIEFFDIDGNEHYDFKFLSKIYDDLSTFVLLLEQQHGIQMLLTYWLMLSNAVIGITSIASKNADYPAAFIARSILPFSWCFLGTYIDDQIKKQVEIIDISIVKSLIDFKCDQSRRAILQTFKQLISTNRLQFTACSLFHLNYSMILGTIVNVITYSVILVQFFISDD